ncbi:MAG: translation initiation factor IF-1 [Candidatus Paceibacterota bacterium]
MDNKQKVKVTGTVIEALPDTKFRVQLEDGREILAYLAGKMRLHYIKVMIGDKVELELSPDGDKGRITFRHKL